MTFKIGKVCEKHPELLGKRYLRRGECVGCKLDDSKQWHRDNSERARELNKQWRSNNRERECEHNKQWRATNKDKVNANVSKRRASKTNASMPTWTNIKQQVDDIYSRAEIQRSLGHDIQIDHIIPLRGNGVRGLHIPYNLQLLNSTDNHKKLNKYNTDWLAPDGSTISKCRPLTHRELKEMELSANINVMVVTGDNSHVPTI